MCKIYGFNKKKSWPGKPSNESCWIGRKELYQDIKSLIIIFVYEKKLSNPLILVIVNKGTVVVGSWPIVKTVCYGINLWPWELLCFSVSVKLSRFQCFDECLIKVSSLSYSSLATCQIKFQFLQINIAINSWILEVFEQMQVNIMTEEDSIFDFGMKLLSPDHILYHQNLTKTGIQSLFICQLVRYDLLLKIPFELFVALLFMHWLKCVSKSFSDWLSRLPFSHQNIWTLKVPVFLKQPLEDKNSLILKRSCTCECNPVYDSFFC